MATEGIFSSFKVSAMGLKAQRLRLDVAAENLANAETTRTPEGVLLKPNINPVDEMLTLIKATRAYEANATAMDAAKEMISRAIDL